MLELTSITETALTAWVIVRHALVPVTVHLVPLDSIFELQIIPVKVVVRPLVLVRAVIQLDVSLVFQAIIY
jgi:hypothetical protein